MRPVQHLCVQYAKPVITNLFMHSLPGMILLYLAIPFYTENVFAQDIIISVRFIHSYRFRIIDPRIATLAKVD